MNKPANNEIALFTNSGLVQYACSVEEMLNVYNRGGRVYEIRMDAQGREILWHKGHQYEVGFFSASDRQQ